MGLSVTSSGRAGWWIALTSTNLEPYGGYGPELLFSCYFSVPVGVWKRFVLVVVEQWPASVEVLQYCGFLVSVSAGV